MEKIHINEVALRDGFQIEPRFIPTETKVALVNALSHAGLSKIEVTSFTSPKAIPALADAEAVMCQIERDPGVVYTALVPNARGAERAVSCGVDELNLVMSCSEGHSLANLRMKPADSLGKFRDIAQSFGKQVSLNVSLSTAFGCPFDGEISHQQVARYIEQLAAMGIRNITLCDTTGMANPKQVQDLCSALLTTWPDLSFTAHFHNTRGMGLANGLAAYQAGIRQFDASLAGLGGCPFAPGASGNVCTEDLVHMFHAMGLNTGVDLNALIAVANEIPEIVGHSVSGQVMKAGVWDRRYPLPVKEAQQ